MIKIKQTSSLRDFKNKR